MQSYRNCIAFFACKKLQGLDGGLDALGGGPGLLRIAESGQAEVALAACTKANAGGADDAAVLQQPVE